MQCFITFYMWSNFKLDMLQDNRWFCAFSLEMFWESATVIFSLTTINILSTSLGFLAYSFWVYFQEEVKSFEQKQCFFEEISKVPKSVNLTNR